MLKNMKVGTRLFMGFGVVLLFIAAGIVTNIYLRSTENSAMQVEN